MQDQHRNVFLELADPALVEQITPLIQQLLDTEGIGIEGILAIASTLINDPLMATALRKFSNDLGRYPGYPNCKPRPYLLYLSDDCLSDIEFFTRNAVEGYLKGNSTKKDHESARSYAVQALTAILLWNPESFRYSRSIEAVRQERRR